MVVAGWIEFFSRISMIMFSYFFPYIVCDVTSNNVTSRKIECSLQSERLGR